MSLLGAGVSRFLKVSGVLPFSSYLLAFSAAVPQAAAGAGSEVSSGGVSTGCCLRDVESRRLAPKGMDASLPCQGLRQEHWRLWGRWNHLGQVASLQWSLAAISYLVRE